MNKGFDWLIRIGPYSWIISWSQCIFGFKISTSVSRLYNNGSILLQLHIVWPQYFNINSSTSKDSVSLCHKVHAMAASAATTVKSFSVGIFLCEHQDHNYLCRNESILGVLFWKRIYTNELDSIKMQPCCTYVPNLSNTNGYHSPPFWLGQSIPSNLGTLWESCSSTLKRVYQLSH